MPEAAAFARLAGTCGGREGGVVDVEREAARGLPLVLAKRGDPVAWRGILEPRHGPFLHTPCSPSVSQLIRRGNLASPAVFDPACAVV